MKSFIDKYSIPLSVVVAGIFIAGAVLLSNFYSAKNNLVGEDLKTGEIEEEDNYYLNALPVSEEDRILGNKDAKLKVVTYADMECPYCIVFGSTMREIVDGSNGQVAWVFRHFPLDSHENAMPAAIASECLADIEGEGKFWDFMDKFEEAVKAGSSIDVKKIAVSLGANSQEFETCYNSEKFSEKISANFNNAIKAGLLGTPYSVIFSDGEPVGVIDGASPIEDVRAELNLYL